MGLAWEIWKRVIPITMNGWAALCLQGITLGDQPLIAPRTGPFRHSHLHLQDADALWMRYGYVAMEYMYMYIQRNPYGIHGGVGVGYSRRISALFTPLVLGVTTNPKLDL